MSLDAERLATETLAKLHDMQGAGVSDVDRLAFLRDTFDRALEQPSRYFTRVGETILRPLSEAFPGELAARSIPTDDTPTQHWSVTVTRNGEALVTIESNCLSGRDLRAEDERVIRMAARHLLAFVGEEKP